MTNMSDLRYSDGYSRGKWSTKEDKLSQHNYRYQGYFSGYETTMDIPKAKVAQAVVIPLLVSLACGYFIASNTAAKGQARK